MKDEMKHPNKKALGVGSISVSLDLAATLRKMLYFRSFVLFYFGSFCDQRMETFR